MSIDIPALRALLAAATPDADIGVCRMARIFRSEAAAIRAAAEKEPAR